MELFDHWDRNTVPANDTELRVTDWFVCAGLLLTVTKLLRFAARFAAAKTRPVRMFHSNPGLKREEIERPASTASPPPIPLRI
jgi:hypothetical protein